MWPAAWRKAVQISGRLLCSPQIARWRAACSLGFTYQYQLFRKHSPICEGQKDEALLLAIASWSLRHKSRTCASEKEKASLVTFVQELSRSKDTGASLLGARSY